MKRYVIAAAALALVAGPAHADPITPAQAAAELELAITVTNNAEAYVYRNGGEIASLNRAAGQYEQSPYGSIKVFRDVGTYSPIPWPSDRVRAKVQGPDYLDNTLLEWELATTYYADLEIPLWPDIIDAQGDRLGVIYTAPRAAEITSADKTAVPEGWRYTITSGARTAIYTVDAAGRVTRLQEGTDQTWEYVAATVTPPTPGTYESLPIVHRAIQAATLRTTLRDLTRRTARSTRGDSLRMMRVMAREAVTIYNGGGEDEHQPIFVKLRIRSIPGGVRVFRKNPITGTFHEWRITQRRGEWRAYRTAP